MNQITILSESKCKDILLQIIKTLSVLIINLNDKMILYYLLSNNFVNKIINIINNDYIKYDEDFLSYYVNFLKSISLKIDITTLHFFFLSQINSFPLLEIALSLYNHQDKMIQSVIKNILLIMLKLNYEPLIEYLCELPALSYFSFISCRIKDLLVLISKENNYEQYKALQEDIIDEVLFIQDIFCLKISKINHIIFNSLFNYTILPYILNAKYDKIRLNIKLYFINVLFNTIHDEYFLNILFIVIFFPSHTIEINNKIKRETLETDNYFYDWNETNNNIYLSSESFYNLIKYNFNFNDKSLKNIFSSKKKFPELSLLKEKYRNKSLDNNNKIKNEIINEILNYFSSEEKNKILSFRENISIGTGINCHFHNRDNENILYDKSFKNIIEKFIVICFDEKLKLKNKLIDNNVKTYLYSLITIKQNNDNILLLICLIIRNILIKNNKISKIVLENGKIINGNLLSEQEINNIIKINNDNKMLNSILFSEFHEMEDDDEDEDNDKEEDFNKKMENFEKKKEITKKDDEIIKKSVLMNKNSLQNFDGKIFDKIGNVMDDNNDLYFYDSNLIEVFIHLLDIKNNLNPIVYKCLTEIILSLISKNSDNNEIIVFCSSSIKNKIEIIYKDFKNYIINNYKKNQNFHLYAYSKFENQYKVFLSLINFDYDDIIKEGSIILNKNLSNYNLEPKNPFVENIIMGKKYKNEEEKKNELLNNNIINFFLIHDLFYIISNEENNINKNNIEKDLFINNYPLKFEELDMNKQYFLYDLNSNIKYFSCKCKLNKNNISNNFFDSTILLYANNIYVGNSSSNPNYTRIVDKYSISNCSVDNNEKNVDLYIIEDGNNECVEINLIFSDFEMRNKFVKSINEEIKSSRQREKIKFKEFLHKLK